MTSPRVLACLLLCGLAVLGVRCTQTVVTGGSGSEVVGVLVTSTGTPVSGAFVRLDTAAARDSSASADSIFRGVDTSDSKGNFTIHINAGSGTYNLSCKTKDSGLVAFVGDIENDRPESYKGVWTIDVGRRVMKAPGIIRGKVSLSGQSSANVLCYVPGTSFIAVSDDTGGYAITGIPEDSSYGVHFYIQGYLADSIVGVNVVSGQTTRLPDKILYLDPLGYPPPPIELSGTADTAAGTITLAWGAVHVADLAGYIVCRKDSVAATAYLALDTVTDTFFVDFIYRNVFDTVPHAYSYAVRTLDNGTNPSAFSSMFTFDAVPPSWVRTVFHIANTRGDTVSAGDSAGIAAFFSSRATRTVAITWFAGYPDSFFIERPGFNAVQGSDTLFYTWSGSGTKRVYVEALDERGKRWLDSTTVCVRPGQVGVTSVSSTDSSVIITWRKSTDPAFTRYTLFSTDSGPQPPAPPSPVATLTGILDTGFRIVSWKNGVRYYSVVVSTALFSSRPGPAGSGGIRNTPPRFITDTGAIQKTANVGVRYQQKLAVADPNKDSLMFSVLSGGAGILVTDTQVVWTPSVSDTGNKHITVLAADGFGGRDTIEWNVAVTPKNVWSSIDSLSKARRLLSMVALDGTLYAMGGGVLRIDGTMMPYSTVEAFVIGGGGTWTQAAPFSSARYWMACANDSARIFAFGGYGSRGYIATVDSFNGTWSVAGQLPQVRVGAAACAVGKTLYLIGGQSVSGADAVVTDEIDAWDPATGAWNRVASLKTQRREHQAVELGGKIYIIGGLGGSPYPNECMPLQSVEVFDPLSSAMDTVASLNTGRWSFAAAAANDRIYAMGGLCSVTSDSSLVSVEAFDPIRKTWSIAQDMPNGRYGCAAASWGGRIYIAGGVVAGAGGNKESGSVIVFYP